MSNQFINLTVENLMQEHLCCIIRSKKPHPGVESKRSWLNERLEEGHVFRKLDTKGAVFIEYAPPETAWVPVEGENYLYIYCLWVAGEFKGKGYGRQLMEYCLANAKAREKAGVCMLGAKTQKAWLSGQAFAEKYGFETVDTTPDGYRLLVLSFDGTKPWFTENAKRLEIAGQKLTIYYSPSVPISIRVWNWYARPAKRCGRLIPSFWWILWKKPKPCLVHSTTGRYFIRESSRR